MMAMSRLASGMSGVFGRGGDGESWGLNDGQVVVVVVAWLGRLGLFLFQAS